MDDKHLQDQLDFIRLISHDATASFTKMEDFPRAIECLSEILNASFVMLTTVFKDEHNLEYQFKSHLYATGKPNNSDKHLFVKYRFSDCPPQLEDWLQNDIEQVMDKQYVLSCLLPDHLTNIYRGDSEQIFVIPFVSQGDIVGLLSYVAPKTAQFKETFSSAYYVLKSILGGSYRLSKAEIQLQTYQTVLDLMPQRVFWKNRDSMYLGCNEAFSKDASLPNPASIIGVTDHDIFPEQAELYRSDDAVTMSTREHLLCSEEPQTHKNGKTIWLRTSKRPIVTDENVVVGLVGTYDDITQLKTIQHELGVAKNELEQRVKDRTTELTESHKKLEVVIEELKATQDHLVETEKMAALGNLVAGVAHEINTPLGIAVTGASHLGVLAKELKQNVLGGNLSKKVFTSNCDEIEMSSDLILRNLERAADLVRNFKMIAVDQSSDKPENVVLSSYLHNIVAAQAPNAEEKNIKIILTGDENLSVSVYPVTTAQIISSLIENAFIHGFEGIEVGQIKIGYKLLKDTLEFTVEDNGRGIDETLQTKIFEPFYSTSVNHNKGSGLGLSIVYNLVTQKLNGQVVCRSKHDEYCRFIVTMPLLSVDNIENKNKQQDNG